MFWIILICTVLLFIVFVAKKDHLPISGVYSRPGTWYNVKYWIFHWMVTRRKRISASEREAVTGKDAGYGMKSRGSEKEMDCVQPLPLEHPLVWILSCSFYFCVQCLRRTEAVLPNKALVWTEVDFNCRRYGAGFSVLRMQTLWLVCCRMHCGHCVGLWIALDVL